MSDDDKTPRDHTGKIHKPANVRSAGMAPKPPGMISVPQVKELHFYGTTHYEGKTDKKVDLDRENISVEGEYCGLWVQMKVEDHPHEAGINGGRISRLTMTDGIENGRDEKILAHYENGEWDKKPETPQETQALIEAKGEYNGLKPDIKRAFDNAAQKHKPKI